MIVPLILTGLAVLAWYGDWDRLCAFAADLAPGEIRNVFFQAGLILAFTASAAIAWLGYFARLLAG